MSGTKGPARAVQPGVLRLFVLVGLAVSAACGSTSASSAAQERDAQPISEPVRSDFDGLTIRLEFDQTTVVSGEVLNSTLVVENPTTEVVTDTDCRIGAGAYALVPADDPDAEAWLQPTVDCGGHFDMSPGFADRWDGPGFIAANKFGEPLPPGEYLAVLDTDGRSTRLSYPVTISE